MLNAKQQRFCDLYLSNGFNSTQAAIDAGYSEKTARSIGSENLTKPDIEAYIKNKQSEFEEKTGITTAKIISELWEIAQTCGKKIPLKGRPSIKKCVDSAGAIKALEILGRHTGAWEKDNAQKNQNINLGDVNVYNNAPPLAESENDIDDSGNIV